LDETCGTGPFKLVETVLGEKQVFVANEDYWGNVPAYKNLINRFYGESTTMFIDYENGVLDMVVYANEQDVRRVLDGQVAHSKMYLVPEMRVYGLELCKSNEYLSNRLVREAIAYGLDCEELRDAGWGNMLGLVTTSTIPIGVKYRIEVGVHEYNPEKARELIAEAGYEPNEIKLSVGTSTLTSNSNAAVAIQAMLADIGIEVEVKTIDQTSFVVDANSKEIPPPFDMSVGGLAISSLDPDQRYDMNKVYDPNSFAQIKGIAEPEFNAKLFAAAATTDDAERAKLYAEIQQGFYDECYMIPFTQVICAVIMKDYVQNFTSVNPRLPLCNDITFAG
jgi:peptide/nickel transport system substrate-binding protein